MHQSGHLKNKQICKLPTYRTRKDTAETFRQLIFFLWCKLLEESRCEWGLVFMQVCFAVWNVWSRARFVVAPLPKRLRGGNTASGCPCPSLFFSLFLSCSLSLIFPLVSHVPSSPPFPLCLSLLLSSLRALLWCRPPAEEQGRIFHPHFCLCSSLLFPHVSPPALFLHFCPPFLFPYSSPSIHQPSHSHLPVYPPLPHAPV